MVYDTKLRHKLFFMKKDTACAMSFVDTKFCLFLCHNIAESVSAKNMYVEMMDALTAIVALV